MYRYVLRHPLLVDDVTVTRNGKQIIYNRQTIKSLNRNQNVNVGAGSTFKYETAVIQLFVFLQLQSVTYYGDERLWRCVMLPSVSINNPRTVQC